MSELRKTPRGFYRCEFLDANEEECSIQESSAIRDEGLIWLGINKVIPQIFKPGIGWKIIPMPTDGDTLLAGRMHLTQTQVRDLLPALQHFAEHGTLAE